MIIKFNGLLGDSGHRVHIVHTSRVIIAYALESYPDIDNTQSTSHTINIKKTNIKIETKKVRAPIKLTCHWR